jgi:N-acetylmuramoyl-L-alanine amidase
MKRVGFFGACVVVAGVAVFNFNTRLELPLHLLPSAFADSSQLPENATDSLVVFHTPAESAQWPQSVARTDRDAVQPPPRSAAASSATQPSRGRIGGNTRSRGFRGRNIYPGPIPTPADWAPPQGPVRIALQAGHWRASEAPAELSGLKDNGTNGGGKAEWEVNLAIARRTAAMLEEKGYVVDVLPAVVPPGYRAHLFIAIHADGSADTRASGFRVAAPRSDATGRAGGMVKLLEEHYRKASGLRLLPDVTRRMENYYAFNFRRFVHALHPMTIAVILETGFLTSPSDRELIINDPARVARGIVDAVLAFPETPAPEQVAKSGGEPRP